MFTNPKVWIAILVVLLGLPFLLLKILSLTGKRPERDSDPLRLAACPDSPNCVCSEDDRADKSIAPLSYEGDDRAAWSAIKSVLAELGGAEVRSSDRYLWWEFRTPLFGFADDVELRLNSEKKQIEVRSASRVGHSDMDANRKRVEEIRAAFQNAL